MANKSVPQFNEVSTIAGVNYLHLIVGNVDKKIQWANVVSQVDADLSITSTFGSIATQISTINSTISTNDSNAVHKTGNETVGGVKTFSLSPIVPNPTNNTDAANKQWVLSVVGSGGIDGTLTAGKYPVAIDSDTVGDGRIRQTTYTLYIESPDTTKSIVVEDAGIQLFSAQGFFELTDTTLRFGHNLSLIIQGNNIQLDNLTASTVPVLNASKKLESSDVTTTVLGYISTLSSNAQTQISSKLSNALTSAYVFVGNASNVATPVPLTGPVTVNNAGLTAIGTGAITDAMIASSFLKADGTVPLTADWYTGPYKVITDSVLIGDSVEPLQVSGINGGTIYAEGDGLKVFAGGRGIVLDSETAAIHILNGFFKVEPNKGLGKTWISDADGIMTLQAPSTFSMPSPTYANTSTTNTDTNIITCVIPGNTLVSNKDKVVYDFVIGNTGGISGDVSYKVKINSTSLPNDKTVTLNTSSDPITLRVTIERLTSSTFRHTLQYNFTTHTTSLRTVEYSTTSSFDFTTDSTLYIIGNQLTTTRAILGVEGHGVYLKAA